MRGHVFFGVHDVGSMLGARDFRRLPNGEEDLNVFPHQYYEVDAHFRQVTP